MSNTNILPSRRSREKRTRQNQHDKSQNRDSSHEYWGHQMGRKTKNHVRICYININGIGVHKKSAKSEEIRQFMVKKNVDVMGLSETNVNWSKVCAKDTLWERTQNWFEHRSIAVSYNTKDTTGKRRSQQGGTATLLRNKMAHKHKKNGYDTSGLGRWSWISIMGSKGSITRFATVYCPLKTGQGNTVYNQQLRELQEDPTARFWTDLGAQLLEWQSNGDQVIIGGDWNEYIRNINLTEWMALFQMKEAITTLHTHPPPPTYHRGSQAIDGIFVSESVGATRAGYLGFGELPGDHRAIWMEVPTKHIIGYKMHDIPRPRARRLKLDDPRTVDRYNRLLDIYFKTHQVYDILKGLTRDCERKQSCNMKNQEIYNKLDKIREEGMKYAEKKCRKLKMGGVAWSPKIQKARDRILFWTLLIRRRKGCHIGMRRILRIKKKLKINGEKEMLMKELQSKLDEAYQKYKALKKDAYDLRLTYQESLAQAKANTNKGDAVKILREMQQREAMRSMYKQIGNTLKPVKGSTTKIHVRSQTGFREITQTLAMEKYIIMENEQKFHQTEGWSPLLEGKLLQDIGLVGDGPRVEDILNGKYQTPEGSPPAVQRWIDTLKVKEPSHRKWIRTTMEDYQHGWKKVKEKTSSGFLHFGHFKAGTQTKYIGWVHYVMSILPMKYGFSPQRWCQGTDVMILKAPNVFLLDKLRTIVLYEADFNHENRRLGKNGMTVALQQNRIAPEQFSRPGRSAQDNALGKRLVFDHFRFLKRPFAMCSCDLKSCYDRVVHSAASLALQSVGVPKMALKCMFNTIQDLVHCVRTAYGQSKETYGGASTQYMCKPQGLGQGNGAGPTIWSILSSTVFESLSTQGYSTTFCSALSLGLLRLCGFSYVDDSDLIADGVTVQEVYKQLQAILTEWDNLMQVNGAAIAPEKCWWYLVDFTWTGSKWTYTSPLPTDQLKVRDKTGTMQTLSRLQHNKAMEMVGVILAPDGNSKEQVRALRKKTSTWAHKVTKSPMEPDAAWCALKQTILKTVEYPLAATTLTEKETTHVMAPALMVGLPRSNILRTFPRDVLYGPTSLQGLGLTDPYIYQYCRHIQDIVTQPWRKTEVGGLLLTNLEAAKLEAGIYGSIFDTNLKLRWTNTSHSLIFETQKFCMKYNITFNEPGHTITPNCLHDRSIMESISQLPFTNDQLKQINQCRIYCKVISLSDVTDGWGKHLLLQAMPKPVQFRHLYRYCWPEQGKPTQAEWDLWLKALQAAFVSTGRALRKPLGHWNKDYVQQSTSWEFYVHHDSLYQQTDGRWSKRTLKYTRSGRNKIFANEAHPCPPPGPGIQRTRVIESPTQIVSTGHRVVEHIPKLPQCNSLFEIMQQHPDAKWICAWIQIPSDMQGFTQALYRSEAIGVSDGSYKDKWDLCSAGWIVWTTKSEFKGGGTIPGPDGASGSYRGELGGLLGLSIILHIMEQLFPPPPSYSIRLGCDGLSAITRALLTDREYFHPTYKDFDLVARIIDYRSKLTGQIQPFHVQGHQDRQGRPLSRASMLNIRMDNLAKEINQHTHQRRIEVPDALPAIEEGLRQVDFQNEPITHNLCQTLVQRISGERLRQYWWKKRRVTESFLETWIDWKVMATMMKEASHRLKLFISKWTTNQVAVGEIMHRRQERQSDLCPCCGKQKETRIHLLRCPTT